MKKVILAVAVVLTARASAGMVIGFATDPAGDRIEPIQPKR